MSWLLLDDCKTQSFVSIRFHRKQVAQSEVETNEMFLISLIVAGMREDEASLGCADRRVGLAPSGNNAGPYPEIESQPHLQ